MKKRSIKRQQGHYLRCQIKTLKHSGKSPFVIAMLLYAEGEGNARLFQEFLARIVRGAKGHLGRFPFNPKFRKLRLVHTSGHFGRSDHNGPTLGTRGSFSRAIGTFVSWVHETPLAPRVKWPFPFNKIVVPSTALLYPAYKNNNQTRGGLGRVCATGMYRSISEISCKPEFFFNGTRPWLLLNAVLTLQHAWRGL